MRPIGSRQLHHSRTSIFVNPNRGGGPRASSDRFDARAFHQRLPGYAPTRLQDAPPLAEPLGLARLSIKDESTRLGLPAFKILGASWATYRLLTTRLGHDPQWDS